MNVAVTPESIVNAFTSGSQLEPAVAVLLDGTYVVTWQSPGQDGASEGIIAQRFSVQGERLGTEFIVNSTAIRDQREPQIAATDDGGYVIIWESTNQDNPGDGDIGVVGQRFSADGTALGTEFVVNATNITRSQFEPAVTGLPGGGFVVTFTDDQGDGGANLGIRARTYDSAGVPQGDDFAVNTINTTNSQFQSDVAAIQPSLASGGLASGGFVVTWRSDVGDGSGDGIFMQRYAADGTPLGLETQVNVETSGNQFDPEVVGLAGGRFVIVWVSVDSPPAGDGSGNGVFARVFEGNGTPVTGEFPINIETSSNQLAPSVSALSDGGFVVAFTAFTSGGSGDGSSNGVISRTFDADGAPTSGEVIVNEQISGNQDQPAIAGLNQNREYVAVWISDTSGSAGDGAQRGVVQRLFGDPLLFVAAPEAAEIEAIDAVRIFAENTINSPQRIDVDGAVAVSDLDSADFAGGRLIVSQIFQSTAQDDFPAQDSEEQDNFSFDQTGESPVSITGSNVSVNGTVVGTLSSNGQAGAALILDLNTDATSAEVESLLEHLTYQNTSDDPRGEIIVQLQLEDGDGASSEPLLITIQVTPEADADGFVRDELRINTTLASTQQDVVVATLFDSVTGAANGYITVWTSTNQDNAGDNDLGIFARRYDADGFPLGGEFQVNQTVAFTQFEPHAAGLTDGGFVIVWRDDLGDTTNASNDGITLTRFDSNGVPVPAPVTGDIEQTVNTLTSGNQSQPKVAALDNGGYAVVWTSPTSGGEGDGNGNAVFAQLYNAAGATVGGQQQVNQQIDGNQDEADISGLSGGRYVVTYVSATLNTAGDGSGDGVFARIFDQFGVPAAPEFAVNSTTGNDQNGPAVATLTNGDFVVVWRSQAQDGDAGGIYGQRFTDTGLRTGPEFRVNDSVSGNQTEPAITALDDGKFVVSWTDTSTPPPGSGADVFSQVFDADGTRLDSQVRINTEVTNSQQDSNLAFLPGGNYVVVWESNGDAADGFTFNVQQQIFGDVADFIFSEPPVIGGIPASISLDENATNAGTLLFANQPVVVSDEDSPNFDGGSLVFSRQIANPNGDDLNAPDDNTQDNLSLAAIGGVSVVAGTVFVDGIAIGVLTSDGQGGVDLVIDFNIDATVAAIQPVLEAVSYSNTSDNPQRSRSYDIQLTDGDGSLQAPERLEIRLNQQADPGGLVPASGEEQVNTFILGEQVDPEVAALNDGGWIVVWASAVRDVGTTGIFGQRYNADGSLRGPEFKVNSFETGTQNAPVVAALSDGGWVVVWQSNFQDDPGINDVGILAQRYDATGTKVGGEVIINSTVTLSQFDPSVVGDPAGGYVVVWTGDTGDGSGDGIAYQRVDATGALAGPEIFVNQEVSSTQNEPDVAILSTGQSIVVWSSTNSGTAGDGDGTGVFGRIVNADGTFATDEFQINQEAARSQSNPSVTATTAGFAVAWTDTSGQDGAGNGVQARFFDLSGAALGDEFTVNEVRANTQRFPDIVTLSDGRVLVTLESASIPGGSSTDTVGQLFEATGERIDGTFLINEETGSTQTNVSAAALPGGNFVAVWQSVTSGAAGDGSGSGIFQRAFGDPNDFLFGGADELVGLARSVVLSEADVNLGFVRIDEDKAIAVPDLGGSGFTGGALRIDIELLGGTNRDFQAPDDQTQHQLVILNGDVGSGDVSLTGTAAGSDVLVDGDIVGSITSDGSNGQALEITLTSLATYESTEALIGNLAYSNVSDDPEAVRLAVNLSNGAGQNARTSFVGLTFDAEDDLGLVAGEERGVNAHTQSSQNSSEIAELVGGNYVVTWVSTGQDSLNTESNGLGIFAQVYSADDVPIGPEIFVNTSTGVTQNDPDVAATADGGFVIVWETNQPQDDPGQNDFGVFGQRFLADGTKTGEEFQVNQTIAFTQFDPSVEAFVDGGFVVSFTSDSGDGSVDAILAQRFDAAGAAVGDEEVVSLMQNLSDQSASKVAALVDASGNNAGHVVVFVSPTSGEDGDGDRDGVFAHRFNATGASVGAEFLVNTTTNGFQNAPSVTGLGGGGYVVVWRSESTAFGQIFDNFDSPVGTEFRVIDEGLTGTAIDVSTLANGGFVVSWSGAGAGDNAGVFAQTFTATGARVDDAQLVNQATSSLQTAPAIAGLSGGGFVVSYDAATSGDSGDGSGTGVFVRSFKPTLPVERAPEFSDLVRLVTLGADDVTSGTPVILDNGVALSDPDGANFENGSLLVYYTAGATAADVLSIASVGAVSVAGSTISVNGRGIASIDATQDGTAGSNLLISFGPGATVDDARAIIEHVAYAFGGLAADVVNTNRSVGFVVTDPSGAQAEPDSIFLDINAGSNPGSNLALNDFGVSENERSDNFTLGTVSLSEMLAGPVLLDPDVDFDNFAVASFADGLVQIDPNADFITQIISIQNQGTGTGQIGFDGTTVTYENIAIGTINATEDGIDGNNLQIDLTADATEDGVEALIEAFTFQGGTYSFGPSASFTITVGTTTTPTATASSSFTIIDDVTTFIAAPPAEEQVNTITSSSQDTARVAALSDGGYVVVWESDLQDNPISNNHGIFGQRYNALGEEVGAEFQVNEFAFGNQIQAAVAGLSNGDFVVLWNDQNNRDGSGQGIFARLFDASGSPIGGDFQVNEEVSSTQDFPQVVALDGGQFMTFWVSQTSGGAGDGSSEGIFGRIFNDNGTPAGGEFQINFTSSSRQVLPQAERLADGSIVVAWQDNGGSDGNGLGIFAQRLGPDGTLLSFDGLALTGGALADERLINTTTDGAQSEPIVVALSPSATLAAGGFAILWESADNDSNGVFAQIFALDGTPVGEEFQVNTVADFAQDDFDAVGTPDGGFIVLYEDNSGIESSFADQGITAQRVNPDGTPNGNLFIFNEQTSGNQSQPDVTVLNNGSIVGVWTSPTSGTAGDGNANGVFQRIFDAPALPAGAINPALVGFEITVDFLENAVNQGLVLIKPDQVVSLVDEDSANFGGGNILVSRLTGSGGAFDQRLGETEGPGQDQIGLVGSDAVLIDGNSVAVNGTQIGTIVQDGTLGQPFEVLLNADATPELVEQVLTRLAYANTSDGPLPTRQYAVQVTDGDGGSTGSSILTINVTAEADLVSVPQESDRQVNTFAQGAQNNSSVATLFDAVTGDPSGYVIVWQSAEQDRPQDPGFGVFGQRYDASGQLVGSEFRVTENTEAGQTQPQVVGLSNGSFVVVWSNGAATDEVIETRNNDFPVLGRIFGSDGAPLGGDFLVSPSLNSTADLSQVSALADGGFVATWTQNQVDFSADAVQGRVFDADGTARGPAFQLNTFTTNQQGNSDVAELTNGNLIFVWTSQFQDNPQNFDNGVFARIMRPDGTEVVAEFLVNDVTANSQDSAQVSALTGGGFVVVFRSNDGSGTGIFLQRYDNAGVEIGDEIRVNDATISDQFDPQVAALPGGGWIVTWTDANSASGAFRDTLAQVYRADGSRLDGNFVVNQTTASDEDESSVAVLDDSSFVISFTHELFGANQSDGSGFGVFHQIVAAPGAIPVSDNPIIAAVSTTVEMAEADLKAAGLPILAGAALTDADSVDFAGGSLTIGIIENDTVQEQFASPDQAAQDQLAIVPNGRITLGNVIKPDTATASSVFSSGFLAEFTINGSGLEDPTDLSGAHADYVAGNHWTSAGGTVPTDQSITWSFDTPQTLDAIHIWNHRSNVIANNDGYEPTVFDLTLFDASNNVLASFDDLPLAPDTPTSQRFEFGETIEGVSSVRFDVEAVQSSPNFTGLAEVAFSRGLGSGDEVLFDGTVIGTIESDGTDGADLTIALNSNAAPEGIEALLEAVTYQNISDDPELVRLVLVSLSDGDGGSAREVITINITPEVDAGVPVDDDAQTNSFVAGEQTEPAIAALFDPVSGEVNGYVITWTSTNQDATGDNQTGVFGQIYDASGAPVGGEFQVNTTTSFAQQSSAVVGLATGGFVVAWEDGSGSFGESGFQAIIQVFDATGAKVGGEIFADSPSTAGTQDNLALSAFDNGDFLLVRDTNDNTAPFQNVIFGQRFDDAGGDVGTPFQIESATDNGFANPDASVLADGTQIVVFEAFDLDVPGAFDNGVFGQLVSAAGTEIGTPFQINQISLRSQSTPVVAALETGGFVVAYQSNSGDDVLNTGFSVGVYARRYDDTGAPLGDEFLVNELVDGTQRQPDIIAQPGGGFTIVFTDDFSKDGSGSGVFAQSYDGEGNRLDGQIQINQRISSNQDAPAIAALGDGNYVVAFQSATFGTTVGDGSGTGIFHRIVGDPADFGLGGDPVLDGVNETVTFEENTINGVPQLIDANGAAAVSDADSADFDGGSILVSNTVASAPLIDQINPPDDLTQDILGLRQGSQIFILGQIVSVDGTPVGQIVQDGLAGHPFEILLNANADAEIVELLVENLTYANASDDPLPVRQLRIQVTDGDGGASTPALVAVSINPTPDAAIPQGAERQANTFETSNQDFAAITTLANGDFLIVWESNGQDGSLAGIFAQRFDALGNPVAPDGSPLTSGTSGESQINATTSGAQFDPAVAALPDGGFVVTFTSADLSSTGIFAQRFDASGSPTLPDGTSPGTTLGEFAVNLETASTQDLSDIAVLKGVNSGQFVVVWSTFSSNGSGDGSGFGIAAQRFDVDGTALGPNEFIVNTEAFSEQNNPTVEPLSDGGFFVTYESLSVFDGTRQTQTADGSGEGVFGQRFDASGNAVGNEIQLNSTTLNEQFVPRLAVLNTGNLVVTWIDNAEDGSSRGIFAQIYDPSGNAVTEEFRVNDQRLGSQETHDIAALSTGGFVITWTDFSGSDGSSSGVFAQQYNARGNRIDTQFQVNTEVSGAQFRPAVTDLEDGGFAIAWTSDTSGTAGDGDGRGIFYQIYANTAPVVSPVFAVGDEDEVITLNAEIFEASFVDSDGQTLQAIRIDTLPSQGTLSVNGVPVLPGQEVSISELLNGDLTYLGSQDFFGDDDFLWTGSDGISFADVAVVANITVLPVNDAPGLDAGPDRIIEEGANFTQTLTLTDPDVQTRAFTVDFGDGSAVQSFSSSSLSNDISHTYAGEGTFTVTVTVDDNAGEANSFETVSFGIAVVNGAPIAVANSFSISEDSTGELLNVLANDSDLGGDPFDVTLINDQPFTTGVAIPQIDGTVLTVQANGDILFNPNGAFESLGQSQGTSTSFAYTITDDGGLSDQANVTVFINGQNDDTIAQDDDLFANINTPLFANVLEDNGNGADEDPDANADLSITALNGDDGVIGQEVILTSGATVILSADGTLTYDPTTLTVAIPEDSFTYTISDEFSLQSTANVTVTIDATNAPPIAQDDQLTTDENTALIGGDLLADNGNGIDEDPDGDPITIVAVDGVTASVNNQIALGSGALLTVNADGTFDYDPNSQFEDLNVGQSVTESFTYTISDGQGATDQAVAVVSVTGVNDDPTAQSDTFGTDEETAFGDNVITNATTPDTDVDDPQAALFISSVNGSALNVGQELTLNGALLTLNQDGSFTYDPNGAFESGSEGLFAGSTEVTYEISDGSGGSDTASLRVNVTGVNDLPVAQDDLFTIAEGLTLTGDVADDNGNGIDDDVDAFPSPPLLNVIAVTDSAGGSVAIGSQVALPSGALLTINADGTFEYDQNGVFDTLLTNESATETFTYTIDDVEGAQASALVSITITGEGDPPIAEDDTFGIFENELLNGDLFADNGAGSDFDPDLDPIDVVAIDGSPTIVGQPISLTSGAILQVNVDGTFSYDPGSAFDSLGAGEPDFDTFSYTISDGQGGLDSAQVVINLTGENDAPVAVQDAFGVLENGSPVIDNVFLNNGFGADFDPDAGDSFTVTAVNGAPNVGSQITLLSGALLTIDFLGNLTYDPNDSFEFLSVGSTQDDTFTYTITDGEGETSTVTSRVEVTGENDAPTAVDDRFDVVLNQTFAGNVISGVNALPDTNPDQSDLLSVTRVNGSEAALGTDFVLPSGATVNMLSSGEFVYNPGPGNFSPSIGNPDADGFSYTISDGQGGTSTAQVVIAILPAGNTSPSVTQIDAFFTENQDNREVELLDPAFVSDPDLGDNLEIVDVAIDPASTPAGLTIGFSFDPLTATFSLADDQFDELSDGELFEFGVNYDVTDGTATVRNTATITIQGANDAPEVSDTIIASVNEEDADIVIDLLQNASDVDTNDTLFVDNPDLPVAGFTLNGNFLTVSPSNPAIQRLGQGAQQIETFNYQVSDGTDSVPTFAQITITGVNDLPVASALTATFDENDDPIIVDLLGTASDIDLDDLDVGLFTISSSSGDTIASSIDNETGALTITPGQFDELDSGTDELITVNYEITDGIATILNTAAITITGENDPVDAIADQYTLDEDTTLTIGAVAGVLSNDIDLDSADILTVTEITGPSNGSLTLNADGSFTYVPDLNFTGTDSFIYEVLDGNGGAAQATVTLIIDPVNDAPVAADDIYNVVENTALTVNFGEGVLVNDNDVENDPLTASVLDGPQNGSLTLNADGSFIYTPNQDFEGTDSFTYVANDGTEDGNLATVTLDVARPVIQGTAGDDFLVGTGADEIFRSLGGLPDFLIGGGGVDVFEFGDETSNGVRETTYISGFGVDDAIRLVGSDVLSEINLPRVTFLLLGDDEDLVILLGVPDVDNAQFL